MGRDMDILGKMTGVCVAGLVGLTFRSSCWMRWGLSAGGHGPSEFAIAELRRAGRELVTCGTEAATSLGVPSVGYAEKQQVLVQSRMLISCHAIPPWSEADGFR